MTSLQLDTTLLINGAAIGTANNAGTTTAITVRRTAPMSQAGTTSTLADQVIDQATNTTTLGVGTTDIDLTSFTNLQGETAQTFVRVRVLYFEHDSASAATSIVIFNALATAFQGPVSAGASITLLPGERFDMESLTATGWTVDGSHKTLRIVVAGGTATLRYLIAGSTT